MLERAILNQHEASPALPARPDMDEPLATESGEHSTAPDTRNDDDGDSDPDAGEYDAGERLGELLENIAVREAPASVDLRRYESFASALVRFLPPDELPPDHATLVSKIVVLDHRSLHAFGASSASRAEVKALLQNAVISAGYSLDPRMVPTLKPITGAAALYAQAEDIFTRHMESQNRLRYVVGVACGILLLTVVAYLSRYLPSGVDRAFPELPSLIWFAGLGSIVSVLMRLSRLDVVREISRPILIISGIGRPFVASAFALVVCLVLQNKLISVSFGGSDPPTIGVYLVIAFLCGFSERFAQDILDRTEVGFAQARKEP